MNFASRGKLKTHVKLYSLILLSYDSTWIFNFPHEARSHRSFSAKQSLFLYGSTNVYKNTKQFNPHRLTLSVRKSIILRFHMNL